MGGNLNTISYQEKGQCLCQLYRPKLISIFLFYIYYEQASSCLTDCSINHYTSPPAPPPPPSWPSKLLRYCGALPWPRGSVLDLRPPGLKFRILSLESSVISFISPSSGGSLAQFGLYVHKGGLTPHSYIHASVTLGIYYDLLTTMVASQLV